VAMEKGTAEVRGQRSGVLKYKAKGGVIHNTKLT